VRSDHPLVADLALVGVAAVWGLTFPRIKDAVDDFPVMTFLAYRFLAAGALVAIVATPRLTRMSPSGWGWGALMGLFLTAGYVFQTLGLERTSSSHAGFITGLFVVLTPLFGALFFRERIGNVTWLAVVLSTLGLFLLTGRGGSGSTFVGDALVFGCACSFAFHFLVTGRAVREHDVIALLAIQLTLCGIAALVAALATDGLEVPRGSDVWSALVVTALFASAVGFFIQTYAQRRSSPARTALILATEPAFAGLFSYLLKGETLSPAGWVGAGLIMAAIVAVEASPYLKPVPPLPEA
jgi:drug/metabolite transporter (DMT)-like permease